MGNNDERVILHVDLNNFYASVEALHNAHYRTVPMAVCGNIELRHGVVLAKNQLAKEKGVKTGDTIIEAKQKCPNIEFCQANFSLYLKFSKLARNIYERYTDRVESFGIDECWLDVTKSIKLFGSGQIIADRIRNDLIKEVGLTASVGVSFNKIFAKLGSDYKKPNATTLITKENYKQIAFPLPVESLIFVGKATKKKLNHIGIYTIADLANCEVKILKDILGVWGEYLHDFANGKDNSEVKPCGVYSVIKSVGNSTTTKRDMTKDEDLKIIINLLSESVGARLKEYGFKGKCVALYIRNSDLQTQSRQKSIDIPTNSANEIAKIAYDIFKSFKYTNYKLRSLGVQVSSLVKEDECKTQLDMFQSVEDILKKETLEKGIDKIRTKFGYNSIKKAIMYTDESLTELNDAKEENVIHPIGFKR